MCGRFCFIYYLLSDNNIRNIYSTMNINETEMQMMQNKHLSGQGAEQQPETVNEVRTRFYDIFNRMNNATILQ